jgi:Domain of unknown function (DUF4266)
MKRTATFFFILSIIILLSSCHAVKPYQRVYLNDNSMQAGKQSIETFTGHVHNNREGATGGTGSGGSGGCGCN